MLENWMPINASANGQDIDQLISYVHVLMLVLFVGWGSFYVYTLIRFRAKNNPKANPEGVKSHVSSYIEGAVAVFEVILLIAFSIPLYSRAVTNLPKESDAVVVRVIAEQFAWQIQYPGPDGKFGKTDPKLVDVQTNPLGLDKTDPNALDDFFTTNQLHVPTGKPVIVRITSKDVIHSFGLPNFRVKQDAIPGMEVATWFESNKVGTFNIACSQLCGNSHYRMRGFVESQDPQAYATWLSEQKPFFAAETGGSSDSFWN